MLQKLVKICFRSTLSTNPSVLQSSDTSLEDAFTECLKVPSAGFLNYSENSRNG